MWPAAAQQALYELRVHQIELEMQNEELRQTQLALDIQRERYFDLYDLAPVGYCTVSAKGLILEANLTGAGMLGVARGELVKQPLSRFIAQADQDNYYRCIKLLFGSGQARSFELQIVPLQGEAFWARLSATLAHNDGTEVMRIVLSDITERKQTLEDLKLFRECIDHANDVIVITEAEPFELPGPSILFVNDAYERTTGYTREEAIGGTPRMLQGPKTDPATIKRMGQALRQWQPVREEVLNYTKDGREFWSEIDIVPIANETGWYTHWISIQRDITDRKLSQEALRTSQQRLSFAMDSAQMGAWDFDLINDTSWRSLRHDQIFGYASEVLHWDRKIFLQHIAPEDHKQVAHCFEEALRTKLLTFECQVVWPDQSRHWIFVQGQVHSNEQGQAAHVTGIVQDITERKLAEQKIENLAFFDPLTKLPNRQLLLDRLQHSLALNVRQRQYGALILIDLDNFKTLNDTLGHRQGDLLLQYVAQRLTVCIRAGDTLARLGGDEFVVILENLSENALLAASQAAVVAEKILLELGQSYDFGSWTHRCTSSIGITVFGDGLEDVDAVLIRADLAMYKAKDAGRNTSCFFDPELKFEITNRVVLEEDLRTALLEQQFSVHYQAQVDAESRIVGAEALLRWSHPTRGWVSPAEFIPKAEKTGLILPLGFWVLETACTQLALWASQAGMAELTLAVNVSARQFHEDDFVQQVLATLERTGAKAHRLKLELTEGLLVTKVEDLIGKMQALKARGVQFALDDFGTGYSSLAYLKRLPLDQLKIDQSFVRNILTDPDDAAIARTVIALANSLELSVIAEGVETEAQRDLLAGLGCHGYQGYLFSRPLPAQEFEAFIKAP